MQSVHFPWPPTIYKIHSLQKIGSIRDAIVNGPTVAVADVLVTSIHQDYYLLTIISTMLRQLSTDFFKTQPQDPEKTTFQTFIANSKVAQKEGGPGKRYTLFRIDSFSATPCNTPRNKQK